MDMDYSALARRIDHTEFRTTATYCDIRRLCLEADHYGFRAVVIQPIHCSRAAQYLRGSDVAIVAVVGFPTGAFTIAGKGFEARDAIEQGATEIEFVVNVGALRGGHGDLVLEEMRALRQATGRHILRAIVETCALSDADKRTVCELGVEAGIDGLVTSTGYASGEATIEDVRLMKRIVGNAFAVKVFQRTCDLHGASERMDAGATLLGTESGVQMAETAALTVSDRQQEQP